MPSCHDMKIDDVYMCEDCGMELKVVKQCDESEVPADECGCDPCTFVCCGTEIVKKK